VTQNTLVPLVSIIVPVYDRAALLSQCLRSIEQQTFKEWECLVIDDGSTDSSVHIANAFRERDSRFRAFTRGCRQKGAAACRNEGLQQAKGEYVIFLDSDDLLRESCLAGRVELIKKHAGCDFVVFQMEGFTEAPGDASLVWNIAKPAPDLLRFLRLDAPWSITGPIWKTTALRRTGGFDETLPGWQDWQLHVAALLDGARYCRANTPPDSFYRMHGIDKIGGEATSIRQVGPKARYVIQLFEKQARQLQRDAVTQSACIGLMWYLLVQVQSEGCLREAITHWNRLRRLKFIGFQMWFEGLLALTLHGKRGGGLAWRRVAHWPVSITKSVDRSTMLAVRLDASRR
jgi:glycosyltransferase involved in cell wall biosynthesis